MKKNLHAVLVIILSLVFAISLTACSSNKVSNTTDESATGGDSESDKEPADEKEIVIDFWNFSDWTTGDYGSLFETFISEFEETHPGVTINMTGKGSADILAGILTGASSSVLPNVFVLGLGDGLQVMETGVLKDISSEWDSLSDDYKSQFSESSLSYMKVDDAVYGIPISQTTAMLYRNLDVLESVGIDTSTGIKDWDDWVEQMKKLDAAGIKALPSYNVDGWGVLNFVGGVPGVSNDIVDGVTTIKESDVEAAYGMMAKIAPYCSDVGLWDQAAKDLFVSGEIAYYLMGVWEDPNIETYAEEGLLNFDRIPVPGQTSATYGGINSGEFVGITDTDNSDIALEFAAYITDAAQLSRMTEIGRFAYNLTAMETEGAQANDLIRACVEATSNGGMNDAVYFDGFNNACRTPFAEGATAVINGDKTAQEAAAETIAAVNGIIAENLE